MSTDSGEVHFVDSRIKKNEGYIQVLNAAFDLWLANRNMTRKEYYELVNREMKKFFCC